MAIEAIQVAPAAGALANAAEGHLAQTADLANCRTIRRRVQQDDLLAIGGAAQQLAAQQRALDGGR
jgi:hypothetical protein